MLLRRQKYLFTLVAFLILATYQHFAAPQVTQVNNQPKPEVQGMDSERVQAQVVRVVDGDTIEVLVANKREKVRVIGIDTPEVVDPRRPVQCFGKEASSYAKKILSNQTVFLESDSTQADKDKYGRLLRYVWLENATLDFGQEMIAKGYAHEYTYQLPYKYQTEYKQVEKNAREARYGLWGDTACVKSSS